MEHRGEPLFFDPSHTLFKIYNNVRKLQFNFLHRLLRAQSEGLYHKYRSCWGHTNWCCTSVRVIRTDGTLATLARGNAHQGREKADQSGGWEEQAWPEWGRASILNLCWAGQSDMGLLQSLPAKTVIAQISPGERGWTFSIDSCSCHRSCRM